MSGLPFSLMVSYYDFIQSRYLLRDFLHHNQARSTCAATQVHRLNCQRINLQLRVFITPEIDQYEDAQGAPSDTLLLKYAIRLREHCTL